MKTRTSKVNGWIVGTRKLGKIMFLLIRKSEGMTIQVVVKQTDKIEYISKNLKNGDFVRVEGTKKAKFNKKDKEESKFLKSEESEIELIKISLLNESSDLPFEMKDELKIRDDNRYKYRYLDLRRRESSEPIILKSKLINHFRKFLNTRNFLEIDTPILSQFSPEGAKTFLVPSNAEEKLYTLPQSPQIFKQILMMSGFSKYYQIAKNFRNENLRSNRQPEFTQLDIETWMASEKSLFNLVRTMLAKFLTNSMGVEKEKIVFKKIGFDECIEKYGTDKPDIRNSIEIKKIKENFEESYIFLKNVIDLKSLQIEQLEKICAENKKIHFSVVEKCKDEVKRIACFNCEEKEKNCYSHSKDFFTDKKEETGFYIFSKVKNFYSKNELLKSMGRIRSIFNKNFDREQEYHFLWINNWPLFEKSTTEEISSFRHPFTMPKKKFLKVVMNKTRQKLDKVRCEAYDLVCNGEEIASGSLRINKEEVQKKIFEITGFSEERIEKHFGYFLKALSFAAPPHGGIGIGIERLIMVFLRLESLKETIAFPKNVDGTCSLTGAPNSISEISLSLENLDKS